MLDDLEKRSLAEEDAALAQYFRANAWAALSDIHDVSHSWSWEIKELQEQMLALAKAVNHQGFSKLDKLRRCQILTNRANLLNRVGRSIDAIAEWDDALRIMPQFAMALGNRGAGLRIYASLVDDSHERAILALHAYESFCAAISLDAVYDSPNPAPIIAEFQNRADALAKSLNVDMVREMQCLDQGKLGRSSVEHTYRQWCLDKRLFLCPLNDLGPHTTAAVDSLTLPGITEQGDERPGDYSPPPIIGFFNQIKQEYVSARYMLFEGLSSTRVHFSDRCVTLTDTLDYPLYSLASERIRAAFRIAYSLLDKIAFLVDRYWKLGKIPEHISFKNVWMIERKSQILPQFENSKNLPLQGLYWLSKELFDENFKKTTSADAQELHAIRNALEHTYLRVFEGWAEPFMIGTPSASGFGIAIGSDELEAKAIRVMQIARSALCYLLFAIGYEEREKRRVEPHRVVGSFSLYGIRDKRKRRFLDLRK
ncbi:LA2681 family HEPN domain-containing protein [Pannonibacter phragmitetus]|uniref:LA2681 family HEPN domain-containing protein n=1 Tax=Pannonibacter phragmitetus TaxID=121719 RepID=UPI003D2ED1E8